MTHQEMYQQLKLIDPLTLEGIKQLLSEESAVNRETYLKAIDQQNVTPMDYLVCAVCEDDCDNGRINRRSINYSIANSHSVFRVSSLFRNDYYTFIANLPLELISYLPDNIATRLKNKARKLEVENRTKQLQLNEFSYQMFKAQLEMAKRKLGGNEAVAQIQKLPNPTSQQEKEYYDKFIALFWDNLPKKSIQLCDTIIDKNKNTNFSPIKQIYLSKLEETTFSTSEVYISLFDYQIIARQHSISVLEVLYTDKYSEHHNWVSGVPKATPLTQVQLEMTVSQVLVLDYLIHFIQPEGCSCFTKMKSHLMEELAKPIYKDKLQALLPQMQTSYTTALNTIKDMNGLISVHN